MNELDRLWCSKCNKRKHRNQFHRSSRNLSGRQSHCKVCACAARRKCYHANPQKSADYNRHYREQNHEAIRNQKADDYRANLMREKLRRGKNRARKAGLPADDITACELLAEWQRRGIDPERCVYTGELLREGWHVDHAVPMSHPRTPGHVVGNLVPSNASANRSKYRRHWLDFLADRAEAASAA